MKHAGERAARKVRVRALAAALELEREHACLPRALEQRRLMMSCGVHWIRSSHFVQESARAIVGWTDARTSGRVRSIQKNEEGERESGSGEGGG